MDRESRRLDQEILCFMRRYGVSQVPGLAFEWLALKIFRYQLSRNVHYRHFCESARTAGTIPAMPALGFKELVLASFPPAQKRKVFLTSGTTGSAPRGTHFFDTLRLYDAAVVPPFEKYLLPDGARPFFYFLMPSSAQAPHSSLSYMMLVLEKRFGRGRYYVRKEVPQYAALARDLQKAKKPAMLLSTAFALKGFLDFLEENGQKTRLPKGSRLMETGGFKGRVKEISKKALYAQCRDRLGLPPTHCVSEYGMTELSSQMYDTTLYDHVHRIRRKPVKAGPAWLKTQVIDPRTGREAKKGIPGILRHTDLANRGSVLAVQTEDLGVARDGGFELLGRAAGASLRGCSLSYEEFIRRGE